MKDGIRITAKHIIIGVLALALAGGSWFAWGWYKNAKGRLNDMEAAIEILYMAPCVEVASKRMLTVKKPTEEQVQKATENATEICRAILKHSVDHSIHPNWMLKISIVESNLRHVSMSNRFAFGIAQVHLPAWGAHLDDIGTMDGNIRAGAMILALYLKKFNGDYRLATLAYNRGDATVRNALLRGENPANGYYERVKGAV